MQTLNNLFKWSFYISGMTGLTILTGIVASWLTIELLVLLVDITA